MHITGRGLQPRGLLPSLAPGKFPETDLTQGHPSTRKDSTGYRHTEHSPPACRLPEGEARSYLALGRCSGEFSEWMSETSCLFIVQNLARGPLPAQRPSLALHWLSNPCPVPLLDLAVSQHPSSTPGAHPKSSLIPLVLQVALLMKALMPPWGLHPHDLTQT